MVSSERIQVTLTGGAPWGFRLAGGGAMPLTINKIRKKSRANTQGLVEGDAVISINGVPVHDKSQDEALEMVENSGETLELEIFRGDADDMGTSKPKKAIMIGGGAANSEALTMTTSVDEVDNNSSELILTTSVDDFSSNSFEQHAEEVSFGLQMTSSVDDTSSELILSTSVDDSNAFEQTSEEVSFGGLQMTSSVDDTSSELILTTSVDESASFEQPAEEVSFGLQMTSTVDDGSSFETTDNTSGGLILNASVDELSSSANNAAVNEGSSGLVINSSVDDTSSFSKNMTISEIGPTISQVQEEIQSSSTTTVMAEPFSENINVSAPPRLSPFDPSKSLKQPSSSPLSSQLFSPLPFHSTPNTTTNSSIATFDDGQTRKEVTREQRTTSDEGGRRRRVVHQETSITTTTKNGPTFVKSQSSAFNSVQPTEPSMITQQHTTTSSSNIQSNMAYNSNFNQNAPTMHSNVAYNSNQNVPAMQSSYNQNARPMQSNVAYNSNINQAAPNMQSRVAYNTNYNQNAPAPLTSSISTNYLQGPPPSTTFSTSISSDNIGKKHMVPMFKPTKFVPGGSMREIPGLYTQSSPRTEADAMNSGKENMAPMFKVKNNANMAPNKPRSRKDLFQPNMWLPGQQQPTQPSVASQQTEFDTYGHYPVPTVQPGISLVQQRKQEYQQQTSRHYDSDDYEDEYDDDQYPSLERKGRVHVFAPPVEIHAKPDGEYEPYSPAGDEYEYPFYYEDGEPVSPDSSLSRRKKNMYNDSAFYDTPGKHYPTIGEQMKLCKIIAKSLTSQENKQARGAKMFMRRRKRSNKWIHEDRSEWTSSAGDVANIRDLESELSPTDGGSKPLFYFKIPNLKNRVGNEGKQTKMALSQEQFEKLRLSSKKCDHRNIAPDTCFDIVSDLKSSKGRGGRLFERRKERSDKFIVDDHNVHGVPHQPNLHSILAQPVRQEKTPWEAASAGNVNTAFNHITEMERNQKLNRMIQYSPPRKPAPSPMPPHMDSHVPMPTVRTSLKGDNRSRSRDDKNFNRAAKGWSGGGEYPVADRMTHISPVRSTAPKNTFTQQSHQAPQSQQSPQYGNYNNRVKAWQNPGQSPYVNGVAPAPQNEGYNYRKQPEYQAHQPAHQPETRAWIGNQYQSANTSYRDQHYEKPRQQSWQQPQNYGTVYKDEYDYNYVPVDNSYGSGSYTPTSPAYMQPIIPGTDL